MAGVAVGKDRVERSHDAVAHDGVAALFEIKVAADVIDHDKVLVNAGLQVSDRLMEPHPVEAGLFAVGQQAFQVL